MNQFPRIVFDCEVVTPMFLAGADQKSAELRAPSIRGAMRYWYRALLGGRGYTGKELARAEAEVFGSAGMGDVGAQASAVDVLVRTDRNERVLPSKELDSRRNRMVPRADLLKQGSGTGYLWYTAALGENDRGFFPTGTRFQVALVAPPHNKERLPDIQALRRAAASFWLLAQLGGLGTRSRHGAGCFYIRKAFPSDATLLENMPPFAFEAPGRTKLAQIIGEGIEACARMIPPQGQPASEFDALARSTCTVVIANADANSSINAANWIGKEMQAFRTGSYGHDGRAEPFQEMVDENRATKHFLQQGHSPGAFVFKRPGMGLPLTVRYKEEREIGFRGGEVSFAPNNKTRRASPLQIHVTRCGRDFYEVLLTHFRSRFLPESTFVEMSANRRSERIKYDTTLISDFIDGLHDRSEWYVEVPA